MPTGIYVWTEEHKKAQADRMRIMRSKSRIRPLADRFWEKVVKRENGCWEWIGSKHGDGYPQIYVNGHKVSALRISLELAKRPLPPRTEPDHLCRNHACVNPDHLEAVTRRENTMRGLCPEISRRRGRNAKIVRDSLGRFVKTLEK